MTRIVRGRSLAWLALALAGGIAIVAGGERRLAGAAAAPDEVQRGEYLVVIGGCNDCHTPLKMGPHGPEPDMARMLSGHPEDVPLEPLPKIDPEAGWNWAGHAMVTAFAGPWGVSVARNLTPDEETGLGRWSEAQFVRSMREGLHQGQEGGRPVLPPMPWPSIARMTDSDLHAVWVYLRSIPALRNDAPQSIPMAGGSSHHGH